MGNDIINEIEYEKDLGVMITNKLDPEKHINNITKNTLAQISNMKRAFKYIDENMIRKIITTFIRPKLEYAAVLWNPHLKKDTEKLEKVQRAATKWAPTLKDQEYNERLDKLKLQTLQERRNRGDIITLYKCIAGIVHIDEDNYLTYGNRIS